MTHSLSYMKEPGPRIPPSAEGLAGLLNVPLRGQVRFNELSAGLRWKFRLAGLGNGRGIRTPAQAEQFYLRSVPASVRNLGEKAVEQFLKGKQASHVESVANAPGKAKTLGNTVWEYSKNNTQRGSRNMTRAQQLGVSIRNGAHAAGLVAKSAAVNAARGVALAAVLEAPVSVAENAIHVMKGKKAKEDAAKDVAKDVGKAGVAGGVVAGGITVVAAMGAGPMMTVAAPIVGTVGLGVFAFSSAWRIRRAIVGDPDGLRGCLKTDLSCSWREDCRASKVAFHEQAELSKRPERPTMAATRTTAASSQTGRPTNQVPASGGDERYSLCVAYRVRVADASSRPASLAHHIPLLSHLAARWDLGEDS